MTTNFCADGCNSMLYMNLSNVKNIGNNFCDGGCYELVEINAPNLLSIGEYRTTGLDNLLYIQVSTI